MEPSLPVYDGPVDRIRNGFGGLDMGVPDHPVQTIMRQNVSEEALKLDMIRRSNGIHMAMKIASESALSRTRNRVPGLKSSTVLSDTLRANDTSIDFSDVLGDSNNSPFMPKYSVQTLMERKFQIS